MSASSNKYPTGNKSRSAVQKQWELTWKTNRKKRGCEDAWHKLRMIMVICKNVVRDKLICDKLHSKVTCVCVWECVASATPCQTTGVCNIADGQLCYGSATQTQAVHPSQPTAMATPATHASSVTLTKAVHRNQLLQRLGLPHTSSLTV